MTTFEAAKEIQKRERCPMSLALWWAGRLARLEKVRAIRARVAREMRQALERRRFFLERKERLLVDRFREKLAAAGKTLEKRTGEGG